jgi:hypothetical protein
MGPGARIAFERAIRPSAGGPSVGEIRAPEPEAPAGDSGIEPSLPPLNENIKDFVGPHGEPISREAYEDLRLQIFQRTGKDPAQVFDMNRNPPPEAQGGEAEGQQEESGGYAESPDQPSE